MKFRKKPVVIEALPLTASYVQEIHEWLQAAGAGEVIIESATSWPYALIKALGGDVRAETGDWVIRGVEGEFYPCKPGIFDQTYEPAED